ncbi:MAG: glycosyltransferase family 4 protein [Blastocatellia bacterium]|nr:glycosyltransferase family 4 protein [Blastocatellia bacterium]
MGSDALRLAMISPEFPAPPTSGGKKRTFHLLDALARLGTVDLVTFSERPEAEASQLLRPMCRRLNIVRLPEHPRRFLPFLARNLRRVARGIHPLMDRFSEASVREAVEHGLRHGTYDVVVLEHSWIAHYIPIVRNAQPQARIILDCHNIESDLWRQYYERPPKSWYKPAAYRFWRSALEQERTYLARADLVWVVSEIDAQRARALAPSAHIRVLPNGTTPLPEDALAAKATGPPIIGFLGSLKYPPNESGMRFFLDRIWPAIREAVPEAHLMIVGQPTEWLLRRAHADANLLAVGEVSDITPYLRQWALMVVPLLHGGGTRMKILDAWAHGIAVVSTSKGAEGIRATPGEELWIADAPNEFAQAVIHLLRELPERHRLARNGYERARCEYSWNAIAERARHHVVSLVTGNDVSL